MVRALFLDVPQELLEERHRKGLDGRDEVWDGVIHMVPPPSMRHMDVQFELAVVLRTIAQKRGLKVLMETGLFQHEKNYRVPDISIGRFDQMSERGWEGAELVIEVLSPNDESRDKLPFFAKVGIREVWLVDPKTRAIEVLVHEGSGYEPAPITAGAARSNVLGVELATVDGPRLRIRDGDETLDV